MSEQWVSGQWLLDQGVQPFQLMKAVNSCDLPAYDPLTGERVNNPPTLEEEARLRRLWKDFASARAANSPQQLEKLKELFPSPDSTADYSDEDEARLNEIREYIFKRNDADQFIENLSGQDMKAITSPSENISPPRPEDVLTELRATGMNDLKELAAEIDRRCPGLSDAKLGRLLPANKGTTISWDGENSQGRRLRGKKK